MRHENLLWGGQHYNKERAKVEINIEKVIANNSNA